MTLPSTVVAACLFLSALLLFVLIEVRVPHASSSASAHDTRSVTRVAARDSD
jgi:hypothetical protein